MSTFHHTIQRLKFAAQSARQDRLYTSEDVLAEYGRYESCICRGCGLSESGGTKWWVYLMLDKNEIPLCVQCAEELTFGHVERILKVQDIPQPAFI